MGAGQGSLGGIVLGADGPLGGAVITVKADKFTASVTTPTSGQIGRWSVPALPTPGTFVLTVVMPGYRTETVAFDLAAGEHRGEVQVTLARAIGTVSGRT